MDSVRRMKKCPKCGEMVSENVNKCFNCFFDFSNKQAEYELIKEQTKEMVLEQPKIFSINDQYEYDVVSIIDEQTGIVDMELLKNTIKDHGTNGWRLVTAFSNEMGHESHASGYLVPTSKNATNDQTVLIFERCIYRYPRK